jgi:hypothetical protein
MSGPVGAGAGAPATPKPLRTATHEESKELMFDVLGPTPSAPKDGDRILAWIKAHPDIRVDTPVVWNWNGVWQNADSIPVVVILSPDIPPTHPVVAEIVRRMPHDQIKDSYEQTIAKKISQQVGYLKKRTRGRKPYDLVKAKWDMLRGKLLGPITEVRMAESMARQKNLPDEVGTTIASMLSGVTGPVSSQIQTQRVELRKQLGMKPLKTKAGRRTRRRR